MSEKRSPLICCDEFFKVLRILLQFVLVKEKRITRNIFGFNFGWLFRFGPKFIRLFGDVSKI